MPYFSDAVTTLIQVNGAEVLAPAGNVFITVYALSGTTPSSTTIYSDAALSEVINQPFHADSMGNFGFWAPAGTYQYTASFAGKLLGRYTLSNDSSSSTSLTAAQLATLSTAVTASEIGVASGVAPLNSASQVPAANLPTTLSGDSAAISTEATRAEGVEGTNATAISTESTSRAAAVSSEASTRAAAVTAEASRAETAEQAAQATATAAIPAAQRGAASGVAPLDANKLVPVANIPVLNQSTTGTAANVTGLVALANGGTGTASPSLVQGTNITVTGTWPNQTINSTASSSGVSVPATVTLYKGSGAANGIVAATPGSSTDPTSTTGDYAVPAQVVAANANALAANATAVSAATFTPTSTGGVSLSTASLFGDLYNARAMGATCSGVISLLGVRTGTDDTAAVQALLNAQGVFDTPPLGPNADWAGYTTNQNGNMTQGVAELPRGAILAISSTLTLPPGVKLRGNNAVLVWTGASSGAVINTRAANGVDPTTNVSFDYAGNSGNSIEDLTICGPTATNTLVGVQLLNCQGFSLRNILVGGCDVGFDLQRCQYSNELNGLYAQYCTMPLLVRGMVGFGTSSNVCIDMAFRNCRFARSSNDGYGIWIQSGSNITFDHIDGNFCTGTQLVCGNALPDYISRTLVVSTPGAGYTYNSASPYVPLTFTGSGQTTAGQLTGIAQVSSSGTIIGAWMTDGIGDGTGVTAGVTITVPGGTQLATIAAPTIQRHRSVTFARFIDTSTTAAPITCGLIRIENLKVESGTAPDSTYLMYVDSAASIVVEHLKYAGYLRTPANWFRWGYINGTADISCDEFDVGTLGNPSPATGGLITGEDNGLFRVGGALRLKLPHDIGGFSSYVITNSGAPFGGSQIYVESTDGDAKLLSGLGILSNAYIGNTRIFMRYADESYDRFHADGDGLMAWGSGSAAPDTTLSRTAAGVLSANGVALIRGYQQTQVMKANTTLNDLVDFVDVQGGTVLTLTVPGQSTDASTFQRTVRVYNRFNNSGALTINALNASGNAGYVITGTSVGTSITVALGGWAVLYYAGGGNWLQVG